MNNNEIISLISNLINEVTIKAKDRHLIDECQVWLLSKKEKEK